MYLLRFSYGREYRSGNHFLSLFSLSFSCHEKNNDHMKNDLTVLFFSKDLRDFTLFSLSIMCLGNNTLSFESDTLSSPAAAEIISYRKREGDPAADTFQLLVSKVQHLEDKEFVGSASTVSFFSAPISFSMLQPRVKSIQPLLRSLLYDP